MKKLSKFWRRSRSEDGNASVEFVVVVPVFILLFCAVFELGLTTIRITVLEHALDETMRDIRLSTGTTITHDQIRDRICEHGGPLGACQESLKVEMRVIDRLSFELPPVRATCIDKAEDAEPVVTTVANGADSDLMFIRVCYTIDPFFESFGLSGMLKVDSEGNMQLVASSIFAQEPV